MRSVSSGRRITRPPFEHRDSELSIGEWLVPEIPDEMDLGGVYNMTNRCLGGLYELYRRLLGELGNLGERLERALGLVPLPTVPAPETRARAEAEVKGPG